MTQKDTHTFTYRDGFWLLDAGPGFSHLFFDPTRPSSYPPEINNIDVSGFSSSIAWFAHNSDRSGFPSVDAEGCPVVHKDDTLLAPLFRKILTALRREVRYACNLNRMTSHYWMPPKNTDIPYPLLLKRLFFLDVAKKVVAGVETVSSAAKKYGLNKTNVKIWTYMYLDSGEFPFRFAYGHLDNCEQIEAVKDYLNNGYSVVGVCTGHFIFSKSSFRNYYRRHRALVLKDIVLKDKTTVSSYNDECPLRCNPGLVVAAPVEVEAGGAAGSLGMSLGPPGLQSLRS